MRQVKSYLALAILCLPTILFSAQGQAPAPPQPSPTAPMYQQKGEQYRIYNFPGTGESIPYRLFVPSRWTPNTRLPMLVTLRAGLGHDIEAIAGPLLDAHMARRQLVGMTTAKQGLAVDVTFRGALKEGANVEQLVKTLNRTEGIQSVELTRQPALED